MRLQEADRQTILNLALEDGIINIEVTKQQVYMKKREKILKNHPYSIWEGSNKSWYTYLPEGSGKKRRLIKRVSLQRLEEAVIEFYLTKQEGISNNKEALNSTMDMFREEIVKELADLKKECIEILQNPLQDGCTITLEELYPIWFAFKAKHTNATSYLNRIAASWKKYYVHDEIIKTPISELTSIQLDEWVHDIIKVHNLNKKEYYNMSMLIRQILDFAVKKGTYKLTENPMIKVEVNTKMFRHEKKKASETQVYLVNEQKRIEKYAQSRFDEDPDDILALIIILYFQIGLRIGELVAIKEEDISGNYLHIQRQEVTEYQSDDGINFSKSGKAVVDYTKSDAGFRNVYLTQKAREIIELIKSINLRKHYKDDGFLFLYNGKRIKSYNVSWRIKRYCEDIKIPVKSSHKIRKTYISTLIDASVNINSVREQAGHSDEKVTFNNYCFDRRAGRETENMIEQALDI